MSDAGKKRFSLQIARDAASVTTRRVMQDPAIRAKCKRGSDIIQNDPVKRAKWLASKQTASQGIAYRESVSAQKAGEWKDPEVRAAWADACRRGREASGCHTRHRTHMRERWADPECRARFLENRAKAKWPVEIRERRYETVELAAVALGVAPNTIRSWIRKGLHGAYRIDPSAPKRLDPDVDFGVASDQQTTPEQEP